MATSRKIVTPEFRVSYAHIWKPQDAQNGKKCYAVTCIFEPDADLKDMLALVKEAKEAKWPNMKGGQMRSPFRRGTADEYDLDKNPEYEGKIIVTLRSYDRPVGLIGPDKQPILDQAEFYSGCFARASVTCYAYDFQGNKGVSFGLANLMKTRDGEPLVAQHRAEVDFAEIPAGQMTNDQNAELLGAL